MSIIAIIILVICCYIYAFFDPGQHLFLFLIGSILLIILSHVAGFILSVYNSKYFFSATIMCCCIFATTYTILLENIFFLLPSTLLSTVISYYVVKHVWK